MHIVFVIANESSVPYFDWFAQESLNHDDLKFTFVALYKQEPAMLGEMARRKIDARWIAFDPARRKTHMLRCFVELYMLFRRIRPDVVHTHLFDDSVPGLLAARLAGVKTRVITKQDTTFHWYYAPQWVWFDRFNNHNATLIHAVASESLKFIIEKEGAPRHKVRLVRNGFPYQQLTASSPTDIASLKREYGLEGRLVIGTVARYIPWKGHHLIIEAAKRLVDTYPEALFVWAGSDGGSGYRQELQGAVNAAGLSRNILILDRLERSLMPSLYRCMDIYLHPAIREPFGFAIAEAMMNEVPVVSTKTGSTDLVTHQVEAYLLKEGDAQDIVAALSSLLDHPGRRRHLAIEGHRYAREHLSFRAMWNGHMAMYRGELGQ